MLFFFVCFCFLFAFGVFRRCLEPHKGLWCQMEALQGLWMRTLPSNGFWRCIKAHWAFMCRVSSFRDLVHFRTWSSVASLTWPAFLVSLSRCLETGARDLARRRCGISPGISSCVGCLVTETSCVFALGAASRLRRGQQSQFLDPNASINWASLDCGRTKQG